MFGTMRRPEPTAKKGKDPYNYEETMLNARVRRTYEDEDTIHDANMVDKSGKMSTCCLSFRHDICRANVPELAVADSAVSASLLFELVLVQCAIANGSSVDAIAPSPLSPSIAFVPATTNVWVKGYQPVPKPDDCARRCSRKMLDRILAAYREKRLESGSIAWVGIRYYVMRRRESRTHTAPSRISRF
ncbi:uncharacterized protein ARMOST_08349 [Armillaria ostoyae]|uniref:Uncharacterized protein n=1 Tax=Armillaria ostoyae TaxID=47428 RepID=A0A284R8E7_ARMOS|nr:uncharacterized protein ARMOST_08349 [Armillaria ostoyae]